MSDGPTAIGPYVIRGELGRGGMGVVYLGYDPRLDREVAIKVLPTDLAQDPTARERFVNEARSVARLQHPNIVPVYDVGETGDRPYLVMEFVRGSDLAAWLDQHGRLSLAQAAPLLRQIAAGIDAAHARGVVHRDIKPENVLLDETGQAKLTDFGIARVADAAGKGLTRTGMILGTPEYMSPEQAASQSADHRADLYSFGAIAYRMLTGGPPFSGDSALSVIMKHIRDSVPDPRGAAPELSVGAANSLLRMLAKEPNERYASATEFVDALVAGTETLVGGQTALPSSAVAPRGPASTSTPTNHLSWGFLLAALLLVGGLLLLTRYGRHGGEAPAPMVGAPPPLGATSPAPAPLATAAAPPGPLSTQPPPARENPFDKITAGEPMPAAGTKGAAGSAGAAMGDLSIQAGQLMMLGIPEGWSPDNPAPLDKVPAGSVILYRRNIHPKQGPEGVVRLCEQIRSCVHHHFPSAPPPIIAIDHEGGRVNQLIGIEDVTPFPFNGDFVGGVAIESAIQKVYQEGATMGTQLARLGIDLNLAPVVDVITNGKNSDIAERSYSSHAERVQQLGPAFIRGMKGTPVRCCAKHWPGYGPIAQNPHDDLVHTSTSEADWGRIHYPAFQAAFAAGADCVMVGHVIYDFNGTGLPASVDVRAYALLRGAGFQGAVLTDDLEMGGVERLYENDFSKVGVDAVAAGADMVLVCHTPSRAVAVHQALIRAARAGDLHLDEHVARIERLREAR